MINGEIIGPAFVLGLAGSMHCIGMCGPLALSLPVSHKNDLVRLNGGLIYNAGRILSYSLLGLAFGSIGQLIISTGLQNKLSITLGIIILFFLFIPKKFYSYLKVNAVNTPFSILRQSIGKLFQSKKFSSLFFIGILNGLLPCGLVYLALTSSVLTGTSINGAAFMFFFGMGTFPLMLATVFMGSYLNQRIRLRITKALPVFLFIMAVLLIFRGLELGIPFISPSSIHMHAQAAVSCQ